MLNDATKTVIVTEMATELAASLQLDADRYNTYGQMKWQVASCVNMKLPSQPTNMRIDYVEQVDEEGSDTDTSGLKVPMRVENEVRVIDVYVQDLIDIGGLVFAGWASQGNAQACETINNREGGGGTRRA